MLTNVMDVLWNENHRTFDFFIDSTTHIFANKLLILFSKS